MAHTDQRLMQQLHDEHARELYSYALHLTSGDQARAEDVSQETLLRALRHPEVMRRTPSGVRAWLFTVARNAVIDEWRTKRSQNEFPMAVPPDVNAADDRTDELLLSWVVAEALTRLSPDHRAVLLECYYNGASVAEAAERLDIPVGTVKSRTHYALRALHLALDELGVGR